MDGTDQHARDLRRAEHEAEQDRRVSPYRQKLVAGDGGSEMPWIRKVYAGLYEDEQSGIERAFEALYEGELKS